MFEALASIVARYFPMMTSLDLMSHRSVRFRTFTTLLARNFPGTVSVGQAADEKLAGAADRSYMVQPGRRSLGDPGSPGR